MRVTRSSIARASLLAAAVSLVLAACGGGGGATGQVASRTPATVAPASSPTTSADPLEGEWRAEYTCQDSARALRRRLSDKEIFKQRGMKSWKDFDEESTNWGSTDADQPCRGATGTAEVVVRFSDGNLTLCDAKSGGCDVHATYELVGDHSFSINDPSENLCPCTEPWQFEIAGDRLTIHVEPADANTVATWEAAPWIRDS
jgi:hypothetical protein